MKSILPLLSCCFIVFTSTISVAYSQVDQTDSLALADLYHSTRGAGWYNHTHWLDGPVSTWFGVSLTGNRVTGLQLGYNNLAGTLPASFGNLSALSYLELPGNRFNEAIPDVLCTLTQLTYLDLSGNGFTGAIPSAIGNLKNLQYFYAQENRLAGNLPAGLGDLSSLCHLHLQSNKIKGSIPPSIGRCTNLIQLVLFNNQLSGPIPESIGNLSHLYYFLAWNNRLSGKLPQSLGNLKAINDIDLDNNNLGGEIPLSLTKLAQLDALILHDNQLSGSLPEAIGNMKSLETLFLNGNKLTGTIPSAIGNLSLLRVLHLESNGLSGAIPAGIGRVTQLVELDLSNNQLTGRIPSSLRNLSNLYNLYLAHNQLSGTVPDAFGNMPKLQQLFLQDNHLTGALPQSLDLHASLYVDVSRNELSADANVRARFAHYDTHLNLSYNRYTFDGTEYLSSDFPDPIYAPQANISLHRRGLKLAVSAGGTLKNNTYEWFSTETGLGSIRIAGDSTFRPGKSGYYFARVTNAMAPQLTLTTDTVYYELNNPSEAAAPVLALYPNPAVNFVSLTGLNDTKNAVITIADMSGYVWVKATSHQQSVIKLDVSRLKAGNYLVSVTDGERVRTMMFVKE